MNAVAEQFNHENQNALLILKIIDRKVFCNISVLAFIILFDA